MARTKKPGRMRAAAAGAAGGLLAGGLAATALYRLQKLNAGAKGGNAEAVQAKRELEAKLTSAVANRDAARKIQQELQAASKGGNAAARAMEAKLTSAVANRDAAARAMEAKLTSAVANRDAAAKAMEAKLTSAVANRNAARKIQQQLEARVAELLGKENANRNAVAKRLSQASAAATRVTQLEADKAGMAGEIQRLSASLLAAEKEAQVLKAETERSQQNAKARGANLAARNQTILELTQQLQAERTGLAGKLEEAAQEYARLKEEMSRAQARASDNNSLRQTEASLREGLESNKASLQKQLEASLEKLRDADAVSKNLKSKLATARAVSADESKKATQKLAEFKEELQTLRDTKQEYIKAKVRKEKEEARLRSVAIKQLAMKVHSKNDNFLQSGMIGAFHGPSRSIVRAH